VRGWEEEEEEETEGKAVPLRNVMIVTYHFPPSSASGSFRMLGFARNLPAHGWRSTVVAPPGLPWEPVDPALADRVPAETAVYHVPYTTSRVVRKVALMAGWLPPAARACGRAIREQKPEAFLTSGPPHQIHWLGLWLKRRYGLPWLADFRDPWYAEGRMDGGVGLEGLKVRAQEAAVVRAADAVIANAPNACKILRDAHPRHRAKFVTLTNGYDREAFEGLGGSGVIRPRAPGAPVRIVHAGAIYAGRDPRPFLDAVKALAGALPVPLEVNFFGPKPESGIDLSHEAGARGLSDRVLVHGHIPYTRALDEMAGADVLLLMDTPGRTVGVPAKLYEYIGAGRPVLALGERGGDLAQVLEQSGIPYRIAPPGDREAIASALAELAQLSADDWPAPADPHRFSREAIAGRLAALLERVTGRAAEPRAEAPAFAEAAALVES
jgi:glycosyltransferase involved in cell wall biosynthesis